MALNRVWMPSPCYHSRGGTKVRLIVLHTAEGARTIESLGNFFANGNNQVSSQVGADDKRGKVGEYVKRGNASWTQANYNNVSTSMELCGFASWSTSEWKNHHDNMLRNCADWIAEEAKYFNIPITKLTAGQAQGSGRGVCQHRDLGAGGGNHSDCGNGFPMDYVLDLARKGTSKPPEPPPWNEGVDPMISAFNNPNNGNQEVWEVNEKGALWSRFWRASDGTWQPATNRGDGYVGSPSFNMNNNGTLCVFVQRKNAAPDCWSLGKAAGATWSKRAI